MSGLFGSAPEYTPPPPPQAPIEEATFTPGSTDADSAVKTRKLGKKKLQIPTTKAMTSTGINTGV